MKTSLKTLPSQPPPSFEMLVERAKASEVPLARADVDRMFQALQARVQLTQQDAHEVGTDPARQESASAPSKWSRATLGKAALGGMGLLAAAALVYNTQRATDAARPIPNVAAPVEQRPLDVALPVDLDHKLDGARAAEAPQGAAVEAAPHPAEASKTGVTTPPNDASRASSATQKTSAARRRLTSAERKGSAASPLSAPAVNDTSVDNPAVHNAAVSAPATSARVEPSSPGVNPKVARDDGFDASLERLERAERDLRGGNPKAALSLLSEPVVTPLRSRADALRAVALCQSGRRTEGRQLALRHLGRNPQSPYEKRLHSACGNDL